MIYLVIGTVQKTLYMDDNPTCEEEVRMVCANNIKEAKEKFEKYFESQSSDYCVYYSVYNISVKEPII